MSDVPIPTLDQVPFAYENTEFLTGPDGRILRILAEYQEPMARFHRERIQDTVVFFGSARFHALQDAQAEASQRMQLLANTGSTEPAPPDEQPARPGELNASSLQHTRAETAVEMAGYYEDARTLAYLLTDWAKSLPGPCHRFVVTSGGGPGIMEAANRGAYEAGGRTIGLNIALPFEQQPNPYITPSLNFQFHYFFMRKFWFAYLAKALVVFPGGFGTLDEMFELLTLAQTHKLAREMTIVIYGSKYWQGVINLDLLAEKGAIALKDKDLFQFADTPEQAFHLLRAGLEQHVDSPHEPAPVPAATAPDPREQLHPDITQTR